MKTETLEVLEKNTMPKSESTCCGGAPKSNEEACCKLDEDKKAEGESGCGCNSGAKEKSSCC